MNPSLLEWSVTLTAMTAVLLFDVTIIARRPHQPTMTECVARLSFYVSLAVAFGIWVWLFHGQKYGMQFFTGWLTEYSLSVDNLFVFVVVISSFKVPEKYQQQTLAVGIALALLFRGVFIALGGVAITRLSWAFYLFGVFLAYAAVKVFRGGGEYGGKGDNAVVRFAGTHLRTTDDWSAGLRLYVNNGSRRHPKRAITPMFLVVLALASTDLLFAVDSIPAIYGITRQPYLVYAATVFALMGLRQLYFILGRLLNRLTHLSHGLALIMAFIGAKMLLHALRTNTVPFINGGKSIAVPEISTTLTFVFIVVVLLITTATSLYRTRTSNANEGPMQA